MAKDPRDEFSRQSRETKQTCRNTSNFNFRADHSFGGCITAVKWDAYEMENTAGDARLMPSGLPEFIPLSSR